MRHIHSLKDLSLQKTWLTIGVFDGVHRGHQEIIKSLVSGAKKASAKALVLSFHPHPAAILGKRAQVKYLTLPKEKAEIFADLGVDVFLTHPFDREIATLSAKDFMAKIQAKIQLEKLLIGYDFALGKNRQGDADYLAELGCKAGFSLQKFDPLLAGASAISSSRVRDALVDGCVRDAHQLLGRPYALRGSVIRGDGRGRKINVPTANIAVNAEKLIPKNGVYACWAFLRGEKYRAVTNIGIRPTFTPDKKEANIEVHLLDFHREIYGEELKLDFISHLREEKKFASVDALLAQIAADTRVAREILA